MRQGACPWAVCGNWHFWRPMQLSTHKPRLLFILNVGVFLFPNGPMEET